MPEDDFETVFGVNASFDPHTMLDAVWLGGGGERAVDVQINRLRRKIENDPANPVYLQTVRGKGYILYSE